VPYMYRRGTRWLSLTFSGVLPWRKDGKKGFDVGFVNKRLLLLVCCFGAQSFLLVGLGGEADEGEASFMQVLEGGGGSS
jgi:hypothetical protein